MRIFKLKTKDGETINKVNAISVNEAIEKFAIIKNLSVNSLLEIFNVI